MTMGFLTTPKLTKLANIHYYLKWEEGVEIKCKFIHEGRNRHIEADVTITDKAEPDGEQVYGPHRVYITKSWRAVLSELEDKSSRDDWAQRLQYVSAMVPEEHRSGKPTRALDFAEINTSPRQIIQDVLWEGTSALIFGKGGIGKSLFCLNLIQGLHKGYEVAGLDVIQQNTLWLDWETTEGLAHWRNKEILKARGIEVGSWDDPAHPNSGRGHMVFHREMVGPLENNIESLIMDIDRMGIGTLLVDSAIPACGGEAESPKPSQNFFDALSALRPDNRPLSSIIVAHVTKERANTKNASPATPFGSTVWTDRARDTYELRASQKRNARFTNFALHHRKTNMGPLRDSLCFRLTWAEGCTIESINIREDRGLVAGLNLNDQAYYFIEEGGAMSLDQLSRRIEATDADILMALEFDHRLEEREGEWHTSQTDY